VDKAINAAWGRHGDDPEGVAAELPALVEGAESAPAVAGLLVHVLGEHLGRWDEGLALVARLTERFGAEDALRRSEATLKLASGDEEGGRAAIAACEAGEPGSNEARVLAVSAAAIAAHDQAAAAGAWLQRAVTLAEALADDDTAVRAVAITGNNLAVALEEKEDRSLAEDALLRASANTARAFWERAGTWMHIERAEYRLAKTHLALGDVARAAVHARACLEICGANDADALECVFGWEVVALAAAAGGDSDGAAIALGTIDALLLKLTESNRGWVGAEIDKLRAAVASA